MPAFHEQHKMAAACTDCGMVSDLSLPGQGLRVREPAHAWRTTLLFKSHRYSSADPETVQADHLPNGYGGLLVCPGCGKSFELPGQVKASRLGAEAQFDELRRQRRGGVMG